MLPWELGLCERKQVPYKLHSGAVSHYNGLSLPFDTDQRLYLCDQENGNAKLLSQCKSQHGIILWQELTEDNS